jgi:hypothetical protein
VAGGLGARGVLREEVDRVLWLFRRRIYPEVDPGPERELLQRLRRAVRGGGSGAIAAVQAAQLVIMHGAFAAVRR